MFDSPRGRIVGLDLARFVALVGMIATHVWLYSAPETGDLVWFSAEFRGRASALFAVLAGVGVVLSTRTLLSQDRHRPARWMLVGRGSALVALGLTLSFLQPPMLLILVAYGLMFCLLALVLTMPRRGLLALSVFIGLAAPVLSWFVARWSRIGNVTEVDNPSWLNLAEPLRLIRSVLFTGEYPVAIWLTYGLAGMIVGRSLLRAANVEQLRLTAVKTTLVGAGMWICGVIAAAGVHVALGGVFAVLIDEGRIGRPLGGSWTYLLGAGPHNGSSFDLLLTVGFAFTSIGLLVLLGTFLRPVAHRILGPVIGAGSAPLTVYCAHVVLVSCTVIYVTGSPYGELTGRELQSTVGAWWISSGECFAANVALVLLIGAYVAWTARRGPLEALVTWAGRTAARVGALQGPA
jgi:hypothetical protein